MRKEITKAKTTYCYSLCRLKQSVENRKGCGVGSGCLRLMEGADIYQIAKNCRTSVEMIERYYAAHIKTNLDAAAINIMRPKPKKIGKGQRRIQNRPAPSTPHTDV